MFLALGWLFVARVHAQGPVDIRGQLFNGTQATVSNSLENVPVTLFQITAAGPVTKTMPVDAMGNFTFTDVISNATSYFARVDYEGITYFSGIMPPDVAAVTPITMTVYETQTIPANFTLDRVHLILDVQPKKFQGLELVQVTNPSDRAFYLPLPVPADTSDVQFQDVTEETIARHQPDGTILYPVLPTTTDILFGVLVPFTPPTYRLQMPLKMNVAGFNLLLAQTSGASASGTNFVPGAPFTSQSGQQYLVYSAPQQAAGTTFSATIANLPGVDNTSSLQTIIVVGGGLGALLLLTFPVYRRRTLKSKTEDVSERVTQLRALARLDDAYEADEIDQEDYEIQRAALKAELMQDTLTSHQ